MSPTANQTPGQDDGGIVAAGSQVAPGALISACALASPDGVIGRHLLANACASVAHDSVVGDFVTLGPRACVNGSVRIGDGISPARRGEVVGRLATRAIAAGARIMLTGLA
ncbi:hypothetical protein HZ989_03050 [Brevundimonas sp. AJA228-03]|uniref:hypothetical protein n=1 Tax=Brevundimonas sp. AJA228-03 TaxID=2752515 RepID=UPI001ADF4349|nr:hypothetical protein [Brevundimonas sp. AJA228-03]QTN20073.1 hypothetical protein HZ989_03050 [Brevundimonas sp. AJA228-03]